MNLIGISINHRTAPIDLREAVHLSTDEITELTIILKEEIFTDGFILSTCNRTEIFGYPKKNFLNASEIIDQLLKFKPVKNIANSNFNKYFNCSAVKHLFMVASGIDSLIIGDSQILGQTKEAFQLSEDLSFTGTILKRLADTTIKVGRRAIKETNVSEGAVSVSYAAVQVVEKIFADLSTKSALVIGAGETGELAATHLFDKGVSRLAISNRTLSKANALASKLKADVVSFERLAENLHQFDIIFSATSADGFVIQQDVVKNAMRKRRGSPIVLMDIAVPRDIDPASRELENVFYNDIDSLNIIVSQNLKKREEEIPLVQNIIMDEMINFFSWFNTLDVVPAIKIVREFFEEMGSDELSKIKNKISEDDYLKVEDMTRRLIGRLLHNPIVKLRELAETGTNLQEAASHSLMIKTLFNLNGADKTKLNENSNED
ncbi:MAG: glutamyl-tRNA reductase [Bacteroidota bacterium]|nr:glutamyl-tRNA reductase [Bacteroidota bacterium]